MHGNVLIKRGIKANLPERLPLGELVFCTDTSELYVGMGEDQPPKKASANVSAEEIGDIAHLETEYRSTLVGAINELNKKIKYLEENGAIGGNNSAPIISSDHSKYVYTTDDDIVINYYVVDAEGGKLTTTVTVNGQSKSYDINLGNNSIKLGKLDKGSYEVKVHVKDRGGLISNELRFNLTVGSLEITSSFDATNEGEDFEIGQSIEVNYFVFNMEDAPVDVDLTVNGSVVQTLTVRPGNNTITLPSLNIGTHTFSLRAFNGKVYSNTLEFTIVIVNSSTLLLSSDFKPASFTISDRVIIPFRISLKDGKRFKVHRTRVFNGKTIKSPVMTGYLGQNSWDLGYLEQGSHKVSISATTEDGSLSSTNTLEYTIYISASNHQPIQGIKDESLSLYLNCKDKSNLQEDRAEWLDQSGKGVATSLVNFNYVNNGWFDDYLQINGEAYVNINLAPLENGVKSKGFTFDIEYQYFNMGNSHGRIVSCENADTYTHPTNGLTELYTGEGFRISCDEISITGSGATTSSPHSEEIWTRATFVLDLKLGLVLIYVDGIVSSIRNLTTQTFTTPSNIYLGAGRDSKGNIVNNCDCKIRNVRLYHRALSHEEVLQNYQSDMSIPDQIKSVAKNLGNDLPELEFIGSYAGMGEDDDVPMETVRYQPKGGPGEPFELYNNCTVGWQGNSSLKYPVKNYDLTLVEDDGTEFKRQFREDWVIRDSFHIKANMIDSSHSFNLGIAKFISTIYKTPLPPMASDPLVRYAVDGFPILLKENGVNSGIYTFNLSQHRKVFGLSKKNPDHLMYRAEENSAQGAVAFRYWQEEDSVADDGSYIGGIRSEWEKRHPKPKDNPDNTDLSELIKWVATSSDEEFVAEINAGRRIHKEYLLDYFIVSYTFAMVDSLGKNMTLTTWERDENGNSFWYPMFYDMDTAFGFNNEGALIFSPDLSLTDKPGFNTDSYLLERVLKLFGERTDPKTGKVTNEIADRYKELRRTRLKIDTFINIMEEQLIGLVGEKFINEDCFRKYVPYGVNYTHMAKGKKYHHLRDWLKARFLLLDSEYGYTREDDNDKVIIRSDKLGPLEFRIKTNTPQYITFDFGGNNVQTKLCSPNEYTVFSHNHDGSHKDLSISGASYITHLEGLESQNISMLNIEFCKRLTSLKVKGNTALRTLDVSTCERLTYLDCSGCTSLSGELNVNKCYNLKHLNCSNTKLDTVLFTGCSYLKYLDFSHTPIKTLTVANLNSLQSVSLEDLPYLSSLKVTNCIHITSLIATGSTSLTDFVLTDCPELETLNISNNANLSSFSADYCPKIRVLTVTGCKSLSVLDLRNLSNLKEVYSNNSGVQHIKFNNTTWITKYHPSKEYLLTVTGLRYAPAALTGGFGGSQPEQFEGCRKLETFEDTIINISNTPNPHHGRWFFRSCNKLVKLPERFICPNLTTIGDVSYGGMFTGCSSLVDFNMRMDLENINYCYATFKDCSKLKTFSGGFRNLPKLKNMDRMFEGCTEIEEIHLPNTNPTNMQATFNRCTKLRILTLGDTSEVTNFYYTFANCGSLVDLRFIRLKGNVSLIETFKDCTSLEYPPSLDECTPTNMYRTFAYCTSLTQTITVDCSAIPRNYNGSYGLNGTFYYAKNLRKVVLKNADNLPQLNNTFNTCNNLETIEGLTISSACTELNYAFCDCQSLLELPVMDLSKAVRMNGTFIGLLSLSNTEIHLNTTSALLECHYLFKNSCFTRIIIDSLEGVRNTQETFMNCTNLEYVNPLVLSSADHEGSQSMFRGCSSLRVVDITAPLLQSFYQFSNGLTSLEELYLRDTVNARSLFHVAKDRTKLRKVYINKTPYVDNMDSSFFGCTNLEEVTVPIDPSNLVNANHTFCDCPSLTKYPFTSGNFPKVTSMYRTLCNTSFSETPEVINAPLCNNFYGMFERSKITKLPTFNRKAGECNFGYLAINCPNLVSVEIDLLGVKQENNISNLVNGCPKLETVKYLNLDINMTWERGIRNLPSLTRIELPGARRHINVSGNVSLDGEGLNTLFRSLGTATSGATIWIGGTLGINSCDRSIATSKGFIINGGSQ